VLPHHDEHASENGDPAKHGEEISPSFTTLLLPFSLLIAVTFSTPTPVFANYRSHVLRDAKEKPPKRSL
jgi:hypothetical protein